MRHVVLGILGLLGVAFAVAPASAINVPGCGEFVIFAKDDIIFENGLTELYGNIFVQSPTGEVKVGSKNILHGTVTAHKITVGNAAVVDHCVANIIELSQTGTCLTTTIGFNPAAACTAQFPPPPLVAPNVPACVNTNAAVTIAQGDTGATLPPGCYGALRLNKDSTLTLTSGGVYNFKSVRQLNDSTLQASGSPASVNVLAEYTTESDVTLSNLLVNVQSSNGQAVQIFNDSLLENVVINAPNGNVHPHTGVRLRGNTELVGAVFHDIQPLTNDKVCVCPPGFKFANDVSRECVPE